MVGNLPVGTVTFLFTDIEASTRLLQTIGREAFTSLIEEHNRIVRDVVGAAEVSTEGDSFFCAFSRPVQAVEAAVEMQRRVAGYVWEDGVDVLVRMGVHTGEGRLGADDYVGLDVHRAARIAAAAHGGQILVSAATIALVEGALPSRTSLLDLGEHRLKDLSQPEHLYQLSVAGLRVAFPPVSSIGSTRVSLPQPLTDFVGREAELAEILDLVDDARLVTLVGIGGSGKTRLAIEAGREVARSRGISVIFIGLADATGPVTIATTTAGELSLAEQAGRTIEDTLINYLRDRSDLLIFDNCEHVADAVAGLIHRLLQSCRNLRVIATSREALLIAGERLASVGPMQLPDPTRVEAGLHTDAARLFVTRARAARSGFEPAPWADEIGAICRRLEGIPLAIELAAARSGMLSPVDILTRLEDRFSLLTSRTRSGERRHETLEAALDWSFDLLDRTSQLLLMRLSAFRGGFTLPAVQAVCFEPGTEPGYVLEQLTGLGEKSLLVTDLDFTETRFRLLETVRDYAARRLRQSGDRDRAVERHNDYFARFAQAQTRRLSGAEQLVALDLLEADHDNLREAIRHAHDAGNEDRAADLAGRLAWFWYLHAHFTEGEHWATALLQSLPKDPDRPWLRLLIGTAQHDYRIGQYDRASHKLGNAIQLASERRLDRLEMWSHAYLATNEMYRVNMDTALAEADRAWSIAEQIGDPIGLGYATYLQVNAETWLLTAAGELTPQRAAELMARLDPVTTAVRGAGERNMIGHVLQSEATLSAYSGQADRAAAAFDTSIVALTELGTIGCVCHCLEAIAHYAATSGLHNPAINLIGASDRLRQDVGITVAPIEQHFRDEALAHSAEALPATVIESERRTGRGFSLPEAAQLARHTLTELRSPTP